MSSPKYRVVLRSNISRSYFIVVSWSATFSVHLQKAEQNFQYVGLDYSINLPFTSLQLIQNRACHDIPQFEKKMIIRSMTTKFHSAIKMRSALKSLTNCLSVARMPPAPLVEEPPSLLFFDESSPGDVVVGVVAVELAVGLVVELLLSTLSGANLQSWGK